MNNLYLVTNSYFRKVEQEDISFYCIAGDLDEVERVARSSLRHKYFLTPNWTNIELVASDTKHKAPSLLIITTK